MKILKISGREPDELPDEAIAVKEGIVKSEEEIELAYQLAKISFKKRKNIAKKFKYEFLLWLTGKTDIKSALSVSRPKQRTYIAILFGDSDIKGEKPKLRKNAEPLDLEKISLSRIGK